MKPKLIIGIVLFSISFSIHSQNRIDYWNKYKIRNIGEISLPDKFELRNENSQVALAVEIINDGMSEIFEIQEATDKVVFQPKGLNKNPNDVKLYARIIITYYKGNPDDFLNRNDGFNITSNELSELDKFYKENTEDELQKVNVKLLQWDKFSIQNIHGVASLKTSFLRQGLTDSPIQVVEYKIPNNSEMIVITMSYRQSEEDIWSEDIKQIINTFIPAY